MTQRTIHFAPCTPIRLRVLGILNRSGWMTKFDIRDALEMQGGGRVDTDTVAAKVRDLRKAKYGGHCITSRRVDNKSYYEYQLIWSGAGE